MKNTEIADMGTFSVRVPRNWQRQRPFPDRAAAAAAAAASRNPIPCPQAALNLTLNLNPRGLHRRRQALPRQYDRLLVPLQRLRGKRRLSLRAHTHACM